jgi:hypothetical protein
MAIAEIATTTSAAPCSRHEGSLRDTSKNAPDREEDDATDEDQGEYPLGDIVEQVP